MKRRLFFERVLLYVVHGLIMLPLMLFAAVILSVHERFWYIYGIGMLLMAATIILGDILPVTIHAAIQSLVLAGVTFLCMSVSGMGPFQMVVFSVLITVFLIMTSSALTKEIHEQLPQMKMFMGFAAYAGAFVIGFFNEINDVNWAVDVNGILIWPCIGYVVMMIVAMYYTMMRRSCAQRSDGSILKSVKWPNLIIAATVILLMVGVIFMAPLRHLIGSGMVAAIRFLIGLFNGEAGRFDYSTEPANKPNIMPVVDHTSWFMMILQHIYEIVMNILMVLVIAAFLYLLYRVLKNRAKRLAKFVDDWQQSREGYDETVERIDPSEGITDESFSVARKPRVRRRPNLRGLKTPKEKVIAIYRWCCETMKARGRYEDSWTATEVARAVEDNAEGMSVAGDYNRARYSDHPVDDESVEKALKFAQRVQEGK